ncbi:hypothetical protein [Rugamonas aquatica]|uniref:Uncharacterized protein n=1 Tax=Rugamonas aquatica TaxID=2743357 RepID=A0A6A7N3R5_9BURK|nr:hypothetical protein [Rugamonas aquatica]MQA39632.1 hypothetical protein [Rugamonas aquatica]
MPSFADTLTFLTSFKDVVPWIAILLSIAAFWISILNYRRDRAILQATSTYVEDWEGFNACLRVDIVNKGRRPIIISTWVGAATERKFFRRTAGSNWVGHCFVNHKEGITLTERQTHSFQLEPSELDFELQNGVEVIYDDMWITDTLNHKHKIKGIREDLASLKKWAAKQSPQVQASK